MATGNITDEYDERKSSLNCAKPICGLTLEIIVADGTSEKEEVLDEALHPCMNCLLTDLYLEAPAIATAGKTVRLELQTERNNEIFSTGDLDATSAVDHSRHTQRGLRGETAFKIICDDNVTGAKTFYMQFRGL
jgi:hypothetical protein